MENQREKSESSSESVDGFPFICLVRSLKLGTKQKKSKKKQKTKPDNKHEILKLKG